MGKKSDWSVEFGSTSGNTYRVAAIPVDQIQKEKESVIAKA